MFLFVLQLDWRLEHTSPLEFKVDIQLWICRHRDHFFYDEDDYGNEILFTLWHLLLLSFILAGWRVANVVDKNKLP